MTNILSPTRFREVLGEHPTGVAVVTATDEQGKPIGMVVGSFGSVSLDPPLVSFMPDKKSSSWQKLQRLDRFCVNILGSHQEAVCRALASKNPGKFDNITWTPSALGNPVIVGSIARIEITKETIHDAGDHVILLGRVESLDLGQPGTPLLFYRGGYGTFSSQSMISGEAEILEKLRMLDLIRARLESLARELDTEVTAVALVQGEINLIGSFGPPRTVGFPTRVGQRLPFVAPMGGVFAAWGTPQEQAAWVTKSADDAGGEDLCREMIENIRARGCALGFGHERSRRWERAGFQASMGDPEITRDKLRRLIGSVLADYNPRQLGDDEEYELHFAQAPVFDGNANVVMGITVWGPEEAVSRPVVEQFSRRLIDTARAATESLEGKPAEMAATHTAAP